MNDIDNLYERVIGKILNYLSYGNKTEKEIRERLTKYISKLKISDKEKDAINYKVLDRLEQLKLIDDNLVLQDFISNVKNSTKLKNKKYIKDRLFKKGFDKDAIDHALGYFDETYELECAKNDYEKKLRTTKDELKIKKYLLGKGYSFEIVNKVFDFMVDIH